MMYRHSESVEEVVNTSYLQSRRFDKRTCAGQSTSSSE